jgi:glycosyltransferase involved in cell wall biosynthesis
MKLAYIHNCAFPSRAANAIQVVRMCEGLALSGHDVTLLMRRAPETDAADPRRLLAEVYGVKQDYRLILLPPPFRATGTSLGRGIASIRFGRTAVAAAVKQACDLVYARDPLISLVATGSGQPVIHEDHAPPLRPLQTLLRRRLYRSPLLRRIVFISDALRQIHIDRGLVPADDARCLVAHDAASHAQIITRPASDHATPSQLTIGYVGGFLGGRGLSIVLAAARALPQHRFLLAGAARDDQALVGAAIPANVALAGFIPPGELTALYREIDILLMPYQWDTATRGGTRSAAWMSPLKLFEYMASGAAIISSDLPVLREVLTPLRNALLVDPANPQAWTVAIEKLTAAPTLRRALGEAAQADVRERHNWPTRAAFILGELGRGTG